MDGLEPIIQITDAGYRYDSLQEVDHSHWAVREVNLAVNKGEYLAIMGPNGSGKSTLAKMLNALLLPVEGRVEIQGLDTRQEENLFLIRRIVGMVFQNPDNQIVGTTVKDDVAFGLENLGVPPEEMVKRVEEVLNQVGLKGMEKSFPHHLSGGQKQRLAIAGVIAMRPDVIVFDEATSMLDPIGRDEVLKAMKDLHQSGITVIHITHSIREALHAERVVIVANGRVERDQPSKELFRQPEDWAQWSLETPLFVELKNRLLKRGLPVRQEITGMEELVEELWRLMSRT
ncbi:energy-coupling factor transporter ATPase [Melghirimyces algeriensis]|uniref:energy-coupling factor transporter ATPase n=1 Tax=Melghirimyces algeriensis TaxID=910412 RepID=UPI003CCC7585